MKEIRQIAARLLFVLFCLAVAPGLSFAQTFEPMGGPGKKVQIGNEYSAVYSFDKRPKIGTVILKLELLDKQGRKDPSVQIRGRLDMPSMKGAHGTTERSFQMNKNGDYLLPLNLVMRGEWEVALLFVKDKTVIHRGSIRFHV